MFVDVGAIRSTDLAVSLDRRSAYYTDALLLAKLILRSISFDLSYGDVRGWTFLIRTPEAMEAGIRAVLREGLSPVVRVSKYATRLFPGTLTIEPDLRFEPIGAVGDVKYKLSESEWQRGDLYQSVAFAAGAKTTRSSVISFSRMNQPTLPMAHFGEIVVSSLTWDARRETAPEEAAADLVRQCGIWLNEDLTGSRLNYRIA